LVGDFAPLFALLAGELSLAQGNARIAQIDASRALASGRVGLMRAGTALPRTWTVQRYLEQSALLGGEARARARELVQEALRSFEIELWRTRLLGTLSESERKVVLLMNATLLNPQTLVCEGPLDRLESDGLERASTALERAARGRSLIASIAEIPQLGPERSLLDRSDACVVREGGRIIFSGSESDWPRAMSTVSVTVSDNGEAFRAALENAGLRATDRGFVDVLHILEPPFEGSRFFRFLVTLPPNTERSSLFEASLAAKAPIVELVSLPIEATEKSGAERAD
jgi:ABC-type multidrug transport system ATPase subunit